MQSWQIEGLGWDPWSPKNVNRHPGGDEESAFGGAGEVGLKRSSLGMIPRSVPMYQDGMDLERLEEWDEMGTFFW